MKLSVEVDRDENLAPLEIRIKKGHKKLTIKQIYGTGTDTFGFTVEGKRDVIDGIDLVEIFKIVNAQRLDRIGTIDLIELITLISKIDEVSVMKISEVVQMIADTIVKGSENVALQQETAGAGAWVSPTGFTDPNGVWADEANAYDNNTDTYAYHSETLHWGPSYTAFLYLTPAAATVADKLRVWWSSKVGDPPYTAQIDIDVLKDGVWTHVFEGLTEQLEWVEKNFAQGSVASVRIRFLQKNNEYIRIHEVDVWQVPTTGGHLKGSLYAWTGAAFEKVKCNATGQLEVKVIA